eukprot:m.232662 g.232662  ORF g.232662 m.232662 type:complete len:760 (+) comp18886_c7_seq3:142-2421(+)
MMAVSMLPSLWRVVLMVLVMAAVVASVEAAPDYPPSPMNKGAYLIANPAPGAPAARNFRGEYFELYGGPASTRYSEVFWRPQKTPLPSHIVERFNGSVMALTGVEVDIVRRGPQGDESVSSFEEYNHHWTASLVGTGNTFLGVDETTVGGSDGHVKLNWHIGRPGTPQAPTLQMLSEGNGNEHRLSFKSFPTGYAQLIDSPTMFISNPMIINTNKRLTDDTSPGPIANKPSLLPKNSLAPPNASYSGILECPCTDRKVKVSDGYKTVGAGTCGARTSTVGTVDECQSAATVAGLMPLFAGAVKTVSSTSLPPGCSGSPAGGSWRLVFNTNTQSSVPCAGKPDPKAVSTSVSVASKTNIEVSISRDPVADVVTITLSATVSNVWFGAAFNATTMAEQPYAIIVDGSGMVSERKLADHAPGTALEPSLRVINNTYTNGRRTVVVQRTLAGKTASHYSFKPATQALPFISAVGNTPTLAVHKVTGSGTLTFAQPGQRICVCRDPEGNSGTIDGFRWRNPCAPFPVSDLEPKNNAICNFSAYEGGLYCCHDKSILLDSDQTIPEPTDTYQLKYRFYFEDYTNQKNLFRLWWSTEAYDNEYDVPKSPADCNDPSTPPEDCVYTITSHFSGADMFSRSACMAPVSTGSCGDVGRVRSQDNGYFRLVYAAAHCHAPACMSLELWDTDANKLVCRNTPIYGNSTTQPLNELDYIVGIPPCLWGEDKGLSPTPVLHLDQNFTMIKHVNSTNGHWGVMALFQMRGTYMS